jgi:hypothetical protein
MARTEGTVDTVELKRNQSYPQALSRMRAPKRKEPLGKAERRRFPATFAHPSSLLTGRCFPKEPMIIFIVCVRLFSFAPRFTTAASPGLATGDLDCN